MTIAFRDATRADRGFIVPTWSRAYKMSQYSGMIWHEDWAGQAHRQINRALDRPEARAVLAYDTSDPAFFYGWIAGDVTEAMPIVYFIYVKDPFRGQGHARRLFRALGVDPTRPFTYACNNSVVHELCDAGKIPLARFNPNELRYPKTARRGTWQPKP
jgi:GNAT superfamily N-acetyltransferase